MVIIMKDFSMKKRPDYIKNCYREEDGSLTVVFADGTIYDDYLELSCKNCEFKKYCM